MKKMLVIFLILFSKALASSEENKYVDLLPDEEKELFLQKVARRINEEVDTQEDVSVAENTEIPEDDLKRHSDYVKSVIKEEQANFRKSRNNNEGELKGITSEENDLLEEKPLKTKRMAVADPEDEVPVVNVSPNETDVVTEKAPSAPDDNENKDESADMISETNKAKVTSNETDVITEKTLLVPDDNDNKNESEDMISETNKTVEKSSEVQGEHENSHNGTVSIESKVLSTDNTKENTKSKESKEVKLEEDSKWSDSDTQNVSVKNTKEATSHSSENTESNSTTSAVPFDIKKSENNSDTYKNRSSEEIPTKAFQSVLTNDTLKDSNSTESVSSETNSTETGLSEHMSSENNNTGDPLTANTTLTTNGDKDINPKIKPKDDTVEITENDSQTETEGSSSSTTTGDKTTDSPPKITDTKTTEQPTVLTEITLLVTTQEKENVIEDSITHAVTKATTAKPKVKPTKKKAKLPRKTTTAKPKVKQTKKRKLPRKTTTANHTDEKTTEATMEKVVKMPKKATMKKNKPKIYKISKVFKGPKAKKDEKIKSITFKQNNNVIELGNTYFDNNYKVKDGDKYKVYEIPDGGTPFIQEDPAENQPYYVPIYNYSPDNAYFNPLNRLGPNAGDRKIDDNIPDGDDDVIISHDDNTFEIEMEYDRRKKKLSTKHSKSQNIYRFQPQLYETQYTNSKVNREDHLDVDYLFERLKDELAKEVRRNVDENLPEGNLKDYIGTIRKILFKQQNFGAFQNDDGGIGRITRIKPNNQNIFVDSSVKVNSKNRFKKPGDIKGKNKERKMFRVNKRFKTNVEKYMHNDINRVTKTRKIKNMRAIINMLNKRLNNKKAKAKLSNTRTSSSGAVNDQKAISRSADIAKVNTYVQVLNDMVTLDNKALMQYDWLGTTVDIQAALQKLFELVDLLARNENLHPSDKEILKYLLFLHKLATEIIQANDLGALLKKKLELSRNKKIAPHWLKEKGLVDSVWLYLKKEVPELSEYESLKLLNKFLLSVEDGLFDLHEAIKNIAKITKYNNQHWYQNLKELYINLDEKHLLELLLHLTALRLFSLIEESSRNGLEEDYVAYMKENRAHSKKTLDEMIFILNVLEEYKKVVK